MVKRAVKWIWIYPIKPITNTVPPGSVPPAAIKGSAAKTGDDTYIWLWIGLMAISSILLIAGALLRRKTCSDRNE